MTKTKMKHKMHVKRGDLVKVIAGSEKGKIGKVTQIIHKNNKVIIENVNIRTKHVKSYQKQDKGQIIKLEMPIHSSNVMLYSKKNKTASRYNYIVTKDPHYTKQRILKKTLEIIN